jgi:L-idonate 5-dehydrogenase
MKAIVIHAAKDLRIEDQDVEQVGTGQVAVALAAGGICGSDLHYYNHGGFGAIRLKEPMILGHEVAGHVIATGEGVHGHRVGQLVGISPSRPCGSCRYCSEGLFNHCLNMRFYGSAMPFPHIQGAFRETLVADATQCIAADGLTAGEAAMAEPLAVALHATRRAGSLLGKSVLVTGCGPIGALVILAARRAGADLIVATDLSDYTLGMAKRCGADATLNMAAAPGALDFYKDNKGTFDVLYECSGAQAALTGAIAAMRPGATILQLGLGGDMALPMMQITANSLMQKRLIDVKPLISETVGLKDAVKGFELASDRSRAMKVQIAFG